jgi:1-acyl-sn-glycerol-3-phosphate acyltransferase
MKTELTSDKRLLKLLHSEDLGDSETERERALKELILRLEKRIGGLENQLGGVSDIIGQQSELLSDRPSSADLQGLAKKLEDSIKKFAEEFSAEKTLNIQETRDTRFIYEQIKKLADFVSWGGFKQFLNSLMHGVPGRVGEVDEFGMDREFSLMVKPLFDFLYYSYWRVSVRGVENLPEKGRGLVVSNHSGTLPYDGCMIRLASENDHPSHRDIRFLVEDFVYHFPFLGSFMYRTGGVRACQENAERLLETDHLVAVFPEGVKGIGKHYKNRYRLQRFGRGGFIRLALRTRSPIIPCAVIGAEEIHPLFYKSTFMARPLGIPYIPITPTFPLFGFAGLIPLPAKWTIYFGEPIYFDEYTAEHAEDPLLINQLSEQVRTRIQQMIIDGLAARRSVWFG